MEFEPGRVVEVKPPKDDDHCCDCQDGAQHTDLPRVSITISLISIVLAEVIMIVALNCADAPINGNWNSENIYWHYFKVSFLLQT